MGFCKYSVHCCTLLYAHFSFSIILTGKRELFTLPVCYLVSCDCCLAILRGVIGLSAVCECVFSDHTHLLIMTICES